jgi:hypothetical protein
VTAARHSAKKHLCREPTVGTRQRLMAVSFGTANDGPLSRAFFAECLTLGKSVFAECCPLPSVQHSVKGLFAESLTLPSAALGKILLCRVPDKRHSAKNPTLGKDSDSGSETYVRSSPPVLRLKTDGYLLILCFRSIFVYTIHKGEKTKMIGVHLVAQVRRQKRGR